MTVVIIKVNVNKLKADHLFFSYFTCNKVQILCVLFTSKVRSGSSKLEQRSVVVGKARWTHTLLVELCLVEPTLLFTVCGPEGSKQNV